MLRDALTGDLTMPSRDALTGDLTMASCLHQITHKHAGQNSHRLKLTVIRDEQYQALPIHSQNILGIITLQTIYSTVVVGENKPKPCCCDMRLTVTKSEDAIGGEDMCKWLTAGNLL